MTVNGLPCTPTVSDSATARSTCAASLHARSASDVVKPNGAPYRNTEDDWTWLVMHAAKAASWLGYLPFDQIIDARNTEPVINIREPKPELPPQA